MNFILNKKMDLLYKNGFVCNVDFLPECLFEILLSGFVLKNGCILNKILYDRSTSVNEYDFFDKTDYECFVNHIHVNDFSNNNFGNIAYTFLVEVGKLLKIRFPDQSFRGIISIDEISCSVRFHKLRIGESWCCDDINEYKEEGIFIMDF